MALLFKGDIGGFDEVMQFHVQEPAVLTCGDSADLTPIECETNPCWLMISSGILLPFIQCTYIQCIDIYGDYI